MLPSLVLRVSRRSSKLISSTQDPAQEWAEQVDELNRYQEQKRKQEQKEEANV
jgi:hypothetical protein